MQKHLRIGMSSRFARISVLLLVSTFNFQFSIFNFQLSTVSAQRMWVEDFKHVKRHLWNRDEVTVDKEKALLEVVTKEKGFTFEANGTQAAELEEGDGIITVKLPNKTHFVTIKHPNYGQLSWRPPVKSMKRKKHYRITLQAVDPSQEYELQKQWVVMNVSPENVIVRIDSTVTLAHSASNHPASGGVNASKNGRRQLSFYLPLGSHTFHVEAPFYEAVADSFVLTDTAKVELNLDLQPMYSYLTVKADPQIRGLSDAQLLIDGEEVIMQEATSQRLTAGVHHLSMFWGEQCFYDQLVELGPAEKKVVNIAKTDLGRYPRVHKATYPQSNEGTNSKKSKKNESTKSKNKRATEAQSPELAPPTEAEEAPHGVINVYSNVIGADVFIDNVRAGATPCVIQGLLATRDYNISLRKEGYKEVRKTVRPRGNDLVDTYLKMKSE